MRNLLLILLFLFLTGCDTNEPAVLGEDGETAQTYLGYFGYEVVSYEGKSTVVYTKSDLTEMPDKNTWGLQTVKPDEYLDQDIYQYSFLIKNHPLDDQYESGKTRATVMMFDHKVIGGTSFPCCRNDLTGGGYSIDGKTIEEIHEDYFTWSDEWDSIYGE